MNKLPLFRQQDIVVQQLDGELLIYDLAINKAYNLNETSKIIYEACDGKTSFEELKTQYGYSDEVIYLALDELKKNNLLQGEYSSPFIGMNRREVLRKVGLATMVALPVISGIIAPQAINAASAGVCSSICVPVGGNICASCTGPVVLTSYPAGSGCTGTVLNVAPINCTGTVNNTSGTDVQRN